MDRAEVLTAVPRRAREAQDRATATCRWTPPTTACRSCSGWAPKLTATTPYNWKPRP
jgi:hypothetical protein